MYTREEQVSLHGTDIVEELAKVVLLEEGEKIKEIKTKYSSLNTELLHRVLSGYWVLYILSAAVVLIVLPILLIYFLKGQMFLFQALLAGAISVFVSSFIYETSTRKAASILRWFLLIGGDEVKDIEKDMGSVFWMYVFFVPVVLSVAAIWIIYILARLIF